MKRRILASSMADFHLLEPEATRFSSDASESLSIIVGRGDEVSGVQVRLLFPLNKPKSYVQVLNSDGKEIGIVPRLSDLDDDSRRAVTAALDRRYFTPRITSIKGLKQEGGMWHFNVDSNRGAAEFYVRNWRDSAHEIASGRLLLTSVDGQRFEIPNVNGLDQRSQVLLEQLL